MDVGTTRKSSARRFARLKRLALWVAYAPCTKPNQDVYDLLRYGVKVKRSVGDQFETAWLIDWDNPWANHFVVAEEVTIAGEHKKRPDVVLYVNGLALGVIEFKRSKVSVSEGIRQHIGQSERALHPIVLRHRAVRVRG